MHSLHTSSLESNVENTETSNGCSKSVVCSSNFNIVTLLILVCLMVL